MSIFCLLPLFIPNNSILQAQLGVVLLSLSGVFERLFYSKFCPFFILLLCV